MAASPPGFRMETCFDSQELWKLYKSTIINMAVAKNSLSQKRPFLAKRKNYFSDFSEKFPKSTKTFAARDLGLCVGIYVAKKQGLDKGPPGVCSPVILHSLALKIFCFAVCRCWSLLTFIGQFWHFHAPTRRAPLPPSFLESSHNKYTV